MIKVKNFIEAVRKEINEDKRKVFTITFEEKWRDQSGFWLYDHFDRRDSKVLELDDEDIKYLYDKYLPKYNEELKELDNENRNKNIENINKKANEVIRLSEEIKELKDRL